MGLSAWAFWMALVVMFIGIIGIILPIIPGVGLIWLAILAYAIGEQFITVGPFAFIFLTILGVIGVTTDIWVSQIGARIGGASNWSLLLGLATGLLGAAAGYFVFQVGAVPGAIVGALAGIYAAEWRRHQDTQKALQASGGWLLGCLLSGSIQLVIGLLMIAIFIFEVLKG